MNDVLRKLEEPVFPVCQTSLGVWEVEDTPLAHNNLYEMSICPAPNMGMIAELPKPDPRTLDVRHSCSAVMKSALSTKTWAHFSGFSSPRGFWLQDTPHLLLTSDRANYQNYIALCQG